MLPSCYLDGVLPWGRWGTAMEWMGYCHVGSRNEEKQFWIFRNGVTSTKKKDLFTKIYGK